MYTSFRAQDGGGATREKKKQLSSSLVFDFKQLTRHFLCRAKKHEHCFHKKALNITFKVGLLTAFS